MAVLGVLAAILALCITCGDAKKPASEYFPICHRSDPDLSACVKNVMEKIRPSLAKGIPELNIVPIEPLVIPRMEYQEGSGNFRFHQVVRNLKIYGLGKYIVDSVKVDLGTLNEEIKLLAPDMYMEFDYDMDGKILLLPIQGNGNGTFNFTDVTAEAYAKLRRVKRGGEEYLDIENIRWDIDAKGAKIHFNNLFNGDKNLGKATNDFLNENWKDAFNTYKHLPQEAFGEVFKDICNNVYKTYPYKDLLPE